MKDNVLAELETPQESRRLMDSHTLLFQTRCRKETNSSGSARRSRGSIQPTVISLQTPCETVSRSLSKVCACAFGVTGKVCACEFGCIGQYYAVIGRNVSRGQTL